jgi:hypothetical protein
LPPRVTFFLTSETHAVIARLCLLLLTPLALSPHNATPVPTKTLALSLEKITRSICVLRCPRQLSRSPPLAARALRIALKFSAQKANAAAAGRPRARWRKGPVDVDRAVLRAVTVAATPPPILLLASALAL